MRRILIVEDEIDIADCLQQFFSLRGFSVVATFSGEEALDQAKITVNKNAIPFDPLPPGKASGIRLGTPAVTTRGMREPQMEEIARLIDEALTHRQDPAALQAVARKVGMLADRFPLYPELRT